MTRPSAPERVASAATAPVERTPQAVPRERTPSAASPAPPAAASAPRPAVAKAGTPERSTAVAPPPTVAPPATATPPPAAATAPREPVHAIDAQLQRLRLQFVAYSEVPAERFVFIDNQKLVEGQTVENGVVVERIDAASVVLKHAGGRFVLRADPRVTR